MTESFEGAVIAHFESRRGAELESLIRRHGGEPWSAPALSEEAIVIGPADRTIIDRLASANFDLVIALTGAGTTRLFEQARAIGRLAEVRSALDRRTVVARGPKPVFVLRQHGLKPTHVAPEPNTTKELLETLDQISVAGQRVLVINAGEPFAEPTASLRARGALPVELQLYRWALTPTDATRLADTIRALFDGRIDAVLFTTQVQVRHLFDVAARDDRTKPLTDLLRDSVIVGAVGPTSADALRQRGIEPNVMPDHPKMGHLVVATARELAARRSPVTGSPST
jgi:uroporphyrinogen-III synthase